MFLHVESLLGNYHLKKLIKKILNIGRQKFHNLCVKKCLPPTFCNAQEHCLIHQVEEIELCGPVQARQVIQIEEF